MRIGLWILIILVLVGLIGAWMFRQYQMAEASAKAQIQAKDKAEYAACKQAEAEADAAHEASLRNDRLMDENEAYIGRTQGPAAEASESEGLP
jgi:Tfp pilus assembly protein PilX